MSGIFRIFPASMETFPESLRNVAQLIGPEAAIRLSTITGRNCSVYIPAGKINESHKLSVAVGMDNAKLLQQEYGGTLLPMATAKGLKRKAKHTQKENAIRQALERGEMPNVIGKRHGVSAQLVRRIRKHGTSSSGWRRTQRGRHAGCTIERNPIG